MWTGSEQASSRVRRPENSHILHLYQEIDWAHFIARLLTRLRFTHRQGLSLWFTLDLLYCLNVEVICPLMYVCGVMCTAPCLYRSTVYCINLSGLCVQTSPQLLLHHNKNNSLVCFSESLTFNVTPAQITSTGLTERQQAALSPECVEDNVPVKWMEEKTESSDCEVKQTL